jgi:hypothetical protein
MRLDDFLTVLRQEVFVELCFGHGKRNVLASKHGFWCELQPVNSGQIPVLLSGDTDI